jgi:hypothetical protein
VSPYDPEGCFNWSALSKLQALGIEVLTALDEIRNRYRYSDCLCPFAFVPTAKSGIYKSLREDMKKFDWLSSVIFPQTWRSLYHVLGKLDYGEELSEQIESYLLGKR